MRRLRDAGAVILGKTNLSEWANIRSTTRRAGGAGAAASRGTRTSSTATPAARAPARARRGRRASAPPPSAPRPTARSSARPRANGIVGIKPTVGSRQPLGRHPDLAQPGHGRARWRARVRDAAILLGALAGADAGTRRRPRASGGPRSTTRRSSTRHGLEGRASVSSAKPLRLPRARRRRHGRGARARCKEGRRARRSRRRSPRGKIGEPSWHRAALRAEGRPQRVPRAPRARRRPSKTLKDVIAFNEAHATEEMPYFGQETVREGRGEGAAHVDKAYLEALAKCRRLSRTEGIDAVMDKHKLDALVAPTGGPAWLTDCVNGDHFGSATARRRRRSPGIRRQRARRGSSSACRSGSPSSGGPGARGR